MTELEIQALIDRAVMSRPDMQPSDSVALRMSAAGDCPRLLDYKLQRGRGETSLSSAMRLLTGEPIHAFYRETMSAAFGDAFGMTEHEVEITLQSGTKVLGHCDGVLLYEGLVVEVKTVGDSTYTMVKNIGDALPSHKAQGNMYCGALNLKGVLFIYHNRDSGEYMTFISPFNEELYLSTIDKFNEADRRATAKMMSSRPYQDPTCSPCFFCDWKADCYQGFDSQVASGDTRDADADASSMVTELLASRRDRLAMEKVEEKVKSLLSTKMISEGIRVLKHPMATLEVRVGKAGNPLIGIKEK